jgi:hypothetical protein
MASIPIRHDAPRRPAEVEFIKRKRRRHLTNRRNTLVMNIVAATKAGDHGRAEVNRAEAEKVNRMLKELD